MMRHAQTRAATRRTEPHRRSLISAPVNTATTPGSSSAACVSMPLILRGGMRAAHDAGVVHAGHLDVVDVGRGAGDQSRIFAAADTLADERFVCVIVVAIRLRSRLRRGRLHRVHDVLISGAPAEIALQAVADLGIGGIRIVARAIVSRSGSCRAYRSRTAIHARSRRPPARVELAVGGESFDGEDCARRPAPRTSCTISPRGRRAPRCRRRRWTSRSRYAGR